MIPRRHLLVLLWFEGVEMTVNARSYLTVLLWVSDTLVVAARTAVSRW
jgi:hypothetical protein